jgi:hypothetical protein
MRHGGGFDVAELARLARDHPGRSERIVGVGAGEARIDHAEHLVSLPKFGHALTDEMTLVPDLI